MSNIILPVDERIYNNRNIQGGSYYDTCERNSVIARIDPHMKRGGFYLSHEGIYKKPFHSIGVTTPWHHVKHLHTKRCGIDHELKFNLLGYIPPKCLECWKVVVGPRTLKELFLLLEVQKGLNRASKCGIEMRWYTPRLYGGYFYNNSLDQGRERYEEVRKAVSDHISPDVDVILKRACTEYEMIKGPSAMWTMTDNEHKIDLILEDMIDTSVPVGTGQTDWCLSVIHTNWIEWAWKFQDPTVQEYIGKDVDLYPHCMTYHKGDVGQIKAEMLKAKTMVKHKVEPEVVDAVHAALHGFQLSKGIGVKEVQTMLGIEGINPLYKGEGIEIE